MRFLGRVLNDGHALCHGRCHHDVDGCADRNHIQINVRAHQVNGMGMDSSALNLNLGSQSAEAFQMLVNRSAANIAAARKRYLRTLIFAKQRANKIIGSTNAADVFIIYCDLANGRTVNLYGMTVHAVHPCANFLDCLQKDVDITHVWKIFNDHIVICHNGSGQNAERGVLCSTDHNIPNQRTAAFHNILIHYTPLYQK